MKARITLVACVVFFGITALAFPSRAQISAQIVIGAPPPPPVVGAPPPRIGLIWVPGFWDWDDGHYVWRAGRWEHERPGFVYAPAEWVQGHGGWRLVPGHWVSSAGGPHGPPHCPPGLAMQGRC